MVSNTILYEDGFTDKNPVILLSVFTGIISGFAIEFEISLYCKKKIGPIFCSKYGLQIFSPSQ